MRHEYTIKLDGQVVFEGTREEAKPIMLQYLNQLSIEVLSISLTHANLVREKFCDVPSKLHEESMYNAWSRRI